MNFATLPPEINSGRMHEGPGSESMTEAARAWERLATRLYTAAADYHAVTAKLAAMPEMAAPYIDWLTATAAYAEQTATRAAEAASAHETALAAMVPPPDIDANRAQRRSLAVRNCLGQAAPAIADAEAH
jgi:PPE-repeat protein